MPGRGTRESPCPSPGCFCLGISPESKYQGQLQRPGSFIWFKSKKAQYKTKKPSLPVPGWWSLSPWVSQYLNRKGQRVHFEKEMTGTCRILAVWQSIYTAPKGQTLSKWVPGLSLVIITLKENLGSLMSSCCFTSKCKNIVRSFWGEKNYKVFVVNLLHQDQNPTTYWKGEDIQVLPIKY